MILYRKINLNLNKVKINNLTHFYPFYFIKYSIFAFCFDLSTFKLSNYSNNLKSWLGSFEFFFKFK